MDLLGHNGPPVGSWETNLVTGEKLERCPVMALLLADAKHIQEIQQHRDELYPLYRAGHLPRAGGVYEQDARTLAIFREIDRMREAADAAHKRILAEEGDAADGDSVE